MGAEKELIATRMRAKYYERKEEHKCVDCGRQDDFTLSGRSYCRGCAEIKKMQQRRARERDPEKTRRSTRKSIIKLRSQRKAEGVCIACGKVPPAGGKTMCETCLRKMRDYDKRYYQSVRLRIKMCAYQGDEGELACLNCTMESCIYDTEDR